MVDDYSPKLGLFSEKGKECWGNAVPAFMPSEAVIRSCETVKLTERTFWLYEKGVANRKFECPEQ